MSRRDKYAQNEWRNNIINPPPPRWVKPVKPTRWQRLRAKVIGWLRGSK